MMMVSNDASTQFIGVGAVPKNKLGRSRISSSQIINIINKNEKYS